MQFLDFFSQYIQYGFKSSEDVVDSALKTMELEELRASKANLEALIASILRIHKEGGEMPEILYEMFPIAPEVKEDTDGQQTV